MPKVRISETGYIFYQWVVPEVRDFKDNTYTEVPEVRNHAMLPYYEQNEASTPERRFTDFLEENTQYIDWWYKNGDNGSEHFAIPYTNSQGKQSLFYVDYIIRMHSGVIFLFDTKTENSDPEAPNKHNALIDYLAEEWNANHEVRGGILIENNKNWMFSPFKIDNTNDLGGWSCFFPSNT